MVCVISLCWLSSSSLSPVWLIVWSFPVSWAPGSVIAGTGFGSVCASTGCPAALFAICASWASVGVVAGAGFTITCVGTGVPAAQATVVASVAPSSPSRLLALFVPVSRASGRASAGARFGSICTSAGCLAALFVVGPSWASGSFLASTGFGVCASAGDAAAVVSIVASASGVT